MALALHRLTNPKLNLLIFRGVFVRNEVIEFYSGLDPKDPVNAEPWLSYYAPGTDITEADLMAFVELKRVLQPMILEAGGGKNIPSAVVCDANTNRVIVNLWRHYVARDQQFLSVPALFTSLDAACRWLGFGEGATPELTETVRQEAA
jgi:hypothetical protein